MTIPNIGIYAGFVYLDISIILRWQPDSKKELSQIRRRARSPGYIGGMIPTISVQLLAAHGYGIRAGATRDL
jgi:hypothetical protein